MSKDEIIERLTVCEKVKDLFEMEPDEYMLTSEMADFFGVSEATINRQTACNRDCFISDGMYDVTEPDYILLKAILVDEKVEILNADNLPGRGHKYGNYTSQYDYRLYPKRAVLRMATLLRDSTVAKAVCEQLLNISEVPFKRSSEIKREIFMLKNILRAIRNKSQDLLQWANLDYHKWQNRYLYSVQPFFSRETALAALYKEFGVTPNKVKWRVLNQLIPSQRHPKERTYREALTAAVLKMAKEFYNRDELSDEETDIIEGKQQK